MSRMPALPMPLTSVTHDMAPQQCTQVPHGVDRKPSAENSEPTWRFRPQGVVRKQAQEFRVTFVLRTTSYMRSYLEDRLPASSALGSVLQSLDRVVGCAVSIRFHRVWPPNLASSL